MSPAHATMTKATGWPRCDTTLTPATGSLKPTLTSATHFLHTQAYGSTTLNKNNRSTNIISTGTTNPSTSSQQEQPI
ncbi:hypothetical protein CROQUDRAFT_107680 [Cronartium quercuum f. sp. fusiforme G11]|uniref:Uncharacterized protein n=1 Tax=Cronartium quercuum f. sp. fusiforme G11 TaxID=708437 RepID=A0A9P6TBG1_9BASI|nr:hypothetical protein CROQUDRAFT_107680 [Cronartium quercuum f. sp. fusiforme G11]